MQFSGPLPFFSSQVSVCVSVHVFACVCVFFTTCEHVAASDSVLDSYVSGCAGVSLCTYLCVLVLYIVRVSYMTHLCM